MSAGLMQRERAALVVVDVQEGFRNAIDGFDALVANAAILIQGARVLGLPVLVSEQYPRGLGTTVPELLEHLGGVERHEKLDFSALRAEGLELGASEQALVCGIEAHVCVSQTVHELLATDVEVHVAADAVGSRTPANRDVGLRKMERAGALVTSTEAALFELLGRAGTQEFKTIQKLVL
jgi:nicotinamidase-related amidase